MPRDIRIDELNGVVTKPVERDKLMCEVRMTCAAQELADEGKLFRVPKVIDYDLAEEWIKLEYIPGTVPLHFLLRSPQPPVEVFRRVGKIAAHIHRNIKLDQQHILPLPQEFDRHGPKSFLHADLNHINVHYQSATDQLVFFDWSSSPLIGRIANWGSVYWDLAHFVRSAIVAPPIQLSRKRARWLLADTFLQSYVDHAECGALGRPFFDYCKFVHGFFTGKDRARLQWYRYLRYAVMNLSSYRRYLEAKITKDCMVC